METLVGPASEKKAYHLATALDALLLDKGDEKEADEFPNLTEFWANSDPKIRTLRDEILKLRDQVRYGDPFVIAQQFGKGQRRGRHDHRRQGLERLGRRQPGDAHLPAVHLGDCRTSCPARGARAT